MDEMKQCRKCEEYFPATPEFFYRYKGTKDGLQSYCKTCMNLVSGEWAKVKRQSRYRQPSPQGHADRRKCSRCKHVMPLMMFRKTGNWTNVCDKCQREYSTERGRRSDVVAKKRDYDKRPEVRQRKNERRKADRQAAPEKYRKKYRRYYEAEPARFSAYARKSRLKDRARSRMWATVSRQKYRAASMGLSSDFTTEQWRRCLIYFNQCCAVCGKPGSIHRRLAQDHWIPISRPNCPGTVPTNIVPLCHGAIGACNSSKGNRDPHEWLVSKYGPEKAADIEARITEYFRSLVAE